MDQWVQLAMVELLFFAAATLIVYHYALYPLAAIVLARLIPRRHTIDDGFRPRVSLVIAAYNEEKVIREKIENSLVLDYPRDKLEIIVVSDGSSDATHAIASAYADRGVVALHTPERRGKTAALNRGVNRAQGEIVVFSDANNDFSPNALLALVRHFADPSIGGVSGLKQIKAAAGRESTTGDSLYWRYESALKLAESRLGSITGGDGEIFAVRRALYSPLDERIINDDAAITFAIVGQGRRVLYDLDARSYEYASKNIVDDFFVKVRMVAGGFQTVSLFWRRILLPTTWFDFAFLSHKLLRWLIPELLVLVFVSAWVLSAQPFFRAMLILQVAFYALALYGWTRRQAPMSNVVYIPYYFATMNVAAAFGLYRFIARSQSTAWRKAAR